MPNTVKTTFASVRRVSGEVVRLGAWCDVVTPDELGERLRAEAASADPLPPDYVGWTTFPPPGPLGEALVEEAVEEARRSLSFHIEEFAVLADGRRVTLTDGRGFTTSALLSTGGAVAERDPWSHVTLAELEADVLTTVLPDDAEDTGEEHLWDVLAARLQEHGVEASPAELRALPYDVEFSDRVRARAGGT
jgi:hypothetical protein